MFLPSLLKKRAGVRLKANQAGGEERLTHLSLRLIKVNAGTIARNIGLFLSSYSGFMRNMKALSLLMAVAILGITGFQLYWLKQNYAREKKSLEIKTDLAFRETVMHLQVSKLKLDGVKWEEAGGKPTVKVFVGEDGKEAVKLRVAPRQEIVSTINVVHNKMKDSLKKAGKKLMTISMNKTTVDYYSDSIKFNQAIPAPHGGRDYVLNLLYGVDSLLDSLRLSEIDSAYANRLAKDKLDVPYSVHRTEVTIDEMENDFNRVTVGFVKPVAYELKLGNTFPFLFRQITQPILFSILLLGITILSFVLLYRSLLKQRRLAELKNEFISNITHELKTPIATVGVAIEALKNFNAIDNPQRTKEYLDISGNELQRLSLLVDKVLKLSMFEMKGIDLKYESLNLHDLVQEVAASLKLQLEKHHASLTITTNGDVNIAGDRLHMLSVIFNLLDNALKYGKANPEIRVSINENEKDVLMSVADNGIGITPEYKNKIFEKFFRIPHGDTHNAKGYGLGLSYVAHVVKKHKGRIEVESQQGIGTKFIITLPKNSLTAEK